jgi:hypothetical protein
VTFYTVHEDWGGAFEKHGPYRNEVIGTVAKHQMRIYGYLEGLPTENILNMTFIGAMKK